MKRMIPILLAGLICLTGIEAADLQAGLLGGLRTVADSDMSDVYGNGLWLTPCISLKINPNIAVGLGFSLGYSKDEPIGVLDDDSSFSMSNLELFGRYLFEAGKVNPYLKLGLGLAFYSQTIAAAGIDFSESALSIRLGGGVEYPLSDAFSLIGELGYTILSVEPLDEKVNLGGFSILLGVAYNFTM